MESTIEQTATGTFGATDMLVGITRTRPASLRPNGGSRSDTARVIKALQDEIQVLRNDMELLKEQRVPAKKIILNSSSDPFSLQCVAKGKHGRRCQACVQRGSDRRPIPGRVCNQHIGRQVVERADPSERLLYQETHFPVDFTTPKKARARILLLPSDSIQLDCETADKQFERSAHPNADVCASAENITKSIINIKTSILVGEPIILPLKKYKKPV